MTDLAETFDELRREFSAGLPERLDRFTTWLAALREAPKPETIEAFYLGVHSLKGTAKAYGAEEVASRAANLSSLAGTWYDGGSMPVADLDTAAEHLERLREAIEHYRRDTDPS